MDIGGESVPAVAPTTAMSLASSPVIGALNVSISSVVVTSNGVPFAAKLWNCTVVMSPASALESDKYACLSDKPSGFNSQILKLSVNLPVIPCVSKANTVFAPSPVCVSKLAVGGSFEFAPDPYPNRISAPAAGALSNSKTAHRALVAFNNVAVRRGSVKA